MVLPGPTRDTGMGKLNDTQTILLSTAVPRDDDSALPLSDKLRDGVRVDKSIAGLPTAALVEERDSVTADDVYRADGDSGLGL